MTRAACMMCMSTWNNTVQREQFIVHELCCYVVLHFCEAGQTYNSRLLSKSLERTTCSVGNICAKSLQIQVQANRTPVAAICSCELSPEGQLLMGPCWVIHHDSLWRETAEFMSPVSFSTKQGACYLTANSIRSSSWCMRSISYSVFANV